MRLSISAERLQLGKILVEMGSLESRDLETALIEQRLGEHRERLGTLLLRRGVISALSYMQALSRQRELLLIAR